MGFPDGSVGKESACNSRPAGDMGLVPGLGESPGGGHGNPLHYSCLKPGESYGQRSMEATVHRAAKGQTGLKQLGTYVCICAHTHADPEACVKTRLVLFWG